MNRVCKETRGGAGPNASRCISVRGHCNFAFQRDFVDFQAFRCRDDDHGSAATCSEKVKQQQRKWHRIDKEVMNADHEEIFILM
ncbi:hypothetical protein WR25_17688 [Diploscapter pachys]|uniref:Uncharacterized protein n=1 Tax=Diploscapter pachys TaxID=2018661 RepID=A0A2A2KRZ1_9BILA|nr:hypothetical protein WR25_17688 [Diploscapter pachys]